jgi:primosomal protein N' (replication factor Y)
MISWICLAAQEGVVELSWRLEPGGAGPRIERLVSLTDEGRGAAAGARTLVPPLGRRQREALAELAAAVEPRRASELASRHGAGTLQRLVRRGLASFDLGVRERRPLEDRPEPTRGARPAGRDLTGEQHAAVGEITVAVAERRSVAILLDGVAAAGKTAIYAAAIDAALTAGRSALVLVPEIGLAVPLLDRLRLELGIDVALLHSGLSDGERADEWRRVRDGTARVVVGTRLAILAPLADPGLIVVDEEHDPAYKSDRTPRYQARDLALRLGALAGCPVLLGSATPDVASVGRARMGLLRHIVLPHRLAGIRATVHVVDMRAELASGNRGLLSSRLEVALRELDTAAGDRAILLLNRRGSASVVLCRDCGYVQVCPECQRPLVFHAVGLLLRCHHCGATAPTAAHCPACGSPRIRYVGGGTQRVEREVRVRFPTLRVGRLDRDIVERRGAAVRVVDAFTAGELDVLVGTSVVAKGLDVPEVTLVGVVSADVALNLPDERAAERTFQLLSQAIGRAGRGDRPGVAIVQTYQPDHPAIVAAATDDRERFYDAELAIRERFRSPPFGRLVKLTVAVEDRAAAEAAALEMAFELRRRAEAAGSDVAVLGPSASYIARRAGRWRFQLVLRGSDPVALLDPLPGPSWSIDVDPDSLL